MASVSLFIIMAILAGMLLLAASITATIGANEIGNSIFYNSSTNAFTARQHLTIAAALGWSGLAVLVVILIIGAITGGWRQEEIPRSILHETQPDAADVMVLTRAQTRLESRDIIQLVLLIILIVIALIALVIGIEGVVAAIAIGNMRNRDSPANSAHAEAIATAVIGFVAMVVLIITILIYAQIRSARLKHLEEIHHFLQVYNNSTTVVV